MQVSCRPARINIVQAVGSQQRQMKQALQFRLQQQLALTPQLQQAIKLLQLSSQELETQLIEALETNPLLERGEFSESEVPTTDSESELTGESSDTSQLDAPEESWNDDFETGPTAAVSSKQAVDGRELEIADTSGTSLAEHLLWQLQLSTAEPVELAVGAAIIDAIDYHGYLTESAESICQIVDDASISVTTVERMISKIQQLDPVGVAAADMRDCLRIQLQLMNKPSPIRELAMNLVDNHLEAVSKREFDALCQGLDCDQEDVRRAVEVIRSLEPRPGSLFNDTPTEYIRPDAIVERNGAGQWHARLHDEFLPKIQISSFYSQLMTQTKGADADYMRTQLTEAKWLLRSLETRNDTIFRVANAIVNHQQAFFDHGVERMKPLVLREIAEAVELHESTISRVTTRKYMITPRGVFEFKYFFSSHVGTIGGGEASATAVQAMIRKLIEQEPSTKPLSDAKLATILNEQGIEVARRTVAKYREAMNIESSSKRRRLS